MSVPYSAPLISRLLRGMSPEALSAATPATFQLHPVAKATVKSAVVRELIANESARRRAV